MSEPLFRLVVTRPPEQSADTKRSILLSQDSSFQGALKQAAAANDNPADALRAVAANFVKTTTFIGDPSKTPLTAQIAAFSSAVDKLQLKAKISKTDLTKLVSDSFGADPTKVVQEKDYKDALSGLKDSILAIKQLQEEHSLPIADLANQLQSLELVNSIATTTNDCNLPGAGSQLALLRQQPLQLLDLPLLKSRVSDSAAVSAAQSAARRAAETRNTTITELVESFNTYHSALTELTAINGSHIQSMTQTEIGGSSAPAELTPNTILLTQVNLIKQLSVASLKYINPDPQPPTLNSTADTTSPALDANVLTALAHFTDSILKPSSFSVPSTSTFKPVLLSAAQLKLTQEKVDELSEITKGVLAKEKLSLSNISLDRAVSQIRLSLDGTLQSLNNLAAPGLGDNVSLQNIAGALVAIRTPSSSNWYDIFVGGRSWPQLPDTSDAAVPTTKGNVSPAGVADLLVVRQQLKSYDGADISSIENVLKSEKRDREHTTTRTTTQTDTSQTETTDQETRDLESTSRFEMSKETENTIKTDQSLKAGVNVSASYGPFVKVSASVAGSQSSSQSESTKTASKFSQDITEKSSKNITTRVLQTSALTVTDEVVDKETHSFDNTNGAGNISGVYQWVTKVYEAQIFNYGLRVMYDFMIPEPAAYLIEVFKQAQASAVNIEKPAALTIRADQLTEYNYQTWVSLYGVTDAEAPPEYFKTYAKEMSMASSNDPSINFNKTDEISIDVGYQAIQCAITCQAIKWDDSVIVDVAVGKVVNRFALNSAELFQAAMDNESGNIPIWMLTFSCAQAVVGIEVKAVRTDRAMSEWRLQTFGKIWNAYKARLEEYNEALTQLQFNQDSQITGRDPTTNLTTMRSELKKNCISILTDQHYDLFNAIDIASNGYPQIDIAQNEAEGAYVRFFEDAFEWEEMTWLTYPYFWGRKSQWPSKIGFADADPVYEDFLKSGYCRAVAPVRPGFETAVEHFLTYGELWNGGPLPPITSPLYVPIANEIAERDAKPGIEFAQGDPWEVRVPTTLIKLRKDDSLPVWTKQPDGTWKSNNS